LANEEVIDGKGAGAIRLSAADETMMLRITAYADRLIDDLNDVLAGKHQGYAA
jgi:leucyl-tRNA synthetase